MYKTTVEVSWLANGSKEPSTIFSIENDPRQFDQEKQLPVQQKKEGKKGKSLRWAHILGNNIS